MHSARRSTSSRVTAGCMADPAARVAVDKIVNRQPAHGLGLRIDSIQCTNKVSILLSSRFLRTQAFFRLNCMAITQVITEITHRPIRNMKMYW